MDATYRSLTPIISEEDFIPMVEKKSKPLFSLLNVLADDDITVNKMYYFTLTQESDKLESFLDDHGGRVNLTWHYFSELVACVRNISLAGFQLYHVLDRYSDYLGADDNTLRNDFQDSTYKALEYMTGVIDGFYHAMQEEMSNHGVEVDTSPVPTEEWRLSVTPKLPYTIQDEGGSDEDERIISISQAYRRIYMEFRNQRLDGRIKAKSLDEIIPGRISETIMTEMEGKLHNIQSEYDTYVRGSAIEKANELVSKLRGLTSIPMHILESLKWLVHFYERHEEKARKGYVKDKIAGIVDNERLLEVITNYGLRFCGRYLAEGSKVAEKILSSFVKPIRYELPIPKPLGFHARPSTYVSLVVQEHGTDVFMIVDDEKYDCRSVLDLLQAGGQLADSGGETVIFEGDKRALDDMRILAESNYCEDQNIPKELNYIRILRNL